MLRVTKVTSPATERLGKKMKKKKKTQLEGTEKVLSTAEQKDIVHKGNRKLYFYDKQKQFHYF